MVDDLQTSFCLYRSSEEGALRELCETVAVNGTASTLPLFRSTKVAPAYAKELQSLAKEASAAKRRA